MSPITPYLQHMSPATYVTLTCHLQHRNHYICSVWLIKTSGKSQILKQDEQKNCEINNYRNSYNLCIQNRHLFYAVNFGNKKVCMTGHHDVRTIQLQPWSGPQADRGSTVTYDLGCSCRSSWTYSHASQGQTGHCDGKNRSTQILLKLKTQIYPEV